MSKFTLKNDDQGLNVGLKDAKISAQIFCLKRDPKILNLDWTEYPHPQLHYCDRQHDQNKCTAFCFVVQYSRKKFEQKIWSWTSTFMNTLLLRSGRTFETKRTQGLHGSAKSWWCTKKETFDWKWKTSGGGVSWSVRPKPPMSAWPVAILCRVCKRKYKNSLM